MVRKLVAASAPAMFLLGWVAPIDVVLCLAQSEEVPAVGKTTVAQSAAFSDWLDEPQIVDLIQEKTSAGFYPVAIESREANGQYQCRARFSSPPGEKYFGFAYYRGLTADRYLEATTRAKRNGFQEAYVSSFEDATGVVRFCSIWITSFPKLVMTLAKDPDPDIRARTVFTLSRVGSMDEEVLGVLVRALQRDDSETVRRAAANALRDLRVGHQQAAAALLRSLAEDTSLVVRSEAARSLGYFPQSASQSAPQLMRLIHGKTPCKNDAAIALNRICASYYRSELQSERNSPEQSGQEFLDLFGLSLKEPNEAVDVLTGLLRIQLDSEVEDDDALWKMAILQPGYLPVNPNRLAAGRFRVNEDLTVYLRASAARGLHAMGPAAHEAVPALLQTLHNDESWLVRDEAALALMRIDPKDRRVSRALRDQYMEGPHAENFDHSAQESGSGNTTATTTLVEMLLQPDKKTQVEILSVLARMGPKAKRALPALMEFFRKEDELTLRTEAALTIERIDPSAMLDGESPISLCLQEAIRQAEAPEPFIQVRAIEAITMLGRHGAPAVPILIQACGHSSFSVQKAAVSALGQLGSAARDAVPSLLDLVQEERWRLIPPVAIRALGDIGPAAKDALPTLSNCTRSSNNHVRHEAIRAIVLIGGEE